MIASGERPVAFAASSRAEPHEKKKYHEIKLNPKKPAKTDWRAFDAMSEEKRHRAAVSDPDAQPASEAQLARARRVPSVRALRKKLNLTRRNSRRGFTFRSGLSETGSKARTVRTKPRKCC